MTAATTNDATMAKDKTLKLKIDTTINYKNYKLLRALDHAPARSRETAGAAIGHQHGDVVGVGTTTVQRKWNSKEEPFLFLQS